MLISPHNPHSVRCFPAAYGRFATIITDLCAPIRANLGFKKSVMIVDHSFTLQQAKIDVNNPWFLKEYDLLKVYFSLIYRRVRQNMFEFTTILYTLHSVIYVVFLKFFHTTLTCLGTFDQAPRGSQEFIPVLQRLSKMAVPVAGCNGDHHTLRCHPWLENPQTKWSWWESF